MKNIILVSLILGFILFVSGCGEKELTPEQAEALKTKEYTDLINKKTVKKPGMSDYPPGKVGGTWVSSITNDPKTFNTMFARDTDSRTCIDPLADYLVDYDPYKREWIPNLASFEIKPDEKNDKLDVVFTLRDDLYWTTPAEPDKKVKVTSDDVVYWYNEIDGDKNLQQPGYSGQFVEMKDGSSKRVEIEKIDDLHFVFHYPRIVADPLLDTNMEFGPRYIFEKVKTEKGMEGFYELFGVNTDVKTIPSIGEYYLTEYTPGVRVVLERNPNYWKKDNKGTGYPYIEKYILKIVPDTNTEFLLFKQGEKDGYTVRPEDLDELVNAEKPDYTVYNGGETMGSAFFCFNQNEAAMNKKAYAWFRETKFRQAMSCMLNRDRIARQVYRGLAAPAHEFFARINPLYDKNIKLKYVYNPDRAVKLLAEIGIRKNSQGVMADANGEPISFILNMGVEYNINIEIANIFADECKNIGIDVKVRPIDFQKMVEMLLNTYDWESVIVALGSNMWPTGGSNVWVSSGNFHLWHPLQEKPATEWEARVDYLYNEGRFTINKDKRKKIYDEYQKLLLEQVPLFYICFQTSFLAVRNKWDNVYYDTLNGLESSSVFLKEVN